MAARTLVGEAQIWPGDFQKLARLFTSLGVEGLNRLLIFYAITPVGPTLIGVLVNTFSENHDTRALAGPYFPLSCRDPSKRPYGSVSIYDLDDKGQGAYVLQSYIDEPEINDAA